MGGCEMEEEREVSKRDWKAEISSSSALRCSGFKDSSSSFQNSGYWLMGTVLAVSSEVRAFVDIGVADVEVGADVEEPCALEVVSPDSFLP